MWINYVYILTAENCNLKNIQSRLDKISEDQNLILNKESKIFMHLQPLSEVVISQNLNNNIGYNYDSSLIWILVGLAVVVILSACFNYTNLSIARAMRRVKEVGIRKVSGANTHRIFSQFIFEAVIVSIISLAFSFMLFLLIRPEFLSLDIEYQKTIKLTPGPEVFGWFIALAIFVGLVAGFFPAIFFSKLNSAQILKNASTIRLFKHINIRKGLIIFQYTLTIMFVATVAIAYQQYKHAVNFNLGFTTDNILNIKLLGNKAELVKKEFAQLPEVSAISECAIIPSVGTRYADKAKYKDPMDSIDLYYNVIDENYIPLHQLKLIAGQNFKPTLASDAGESQIIVNEEALKRFNVGTPQEAIGEVFEVNGIKMSIIGVVQNFHYSIVADPIKSFAFRYNPAQIDFVNLKIKTSDITTLMGKIDAAWKKIDPVHPMEAKFFSTEIEEAYYDASGMIKIVGFLSVLSISIASLGLLGMVIFTTETRTKEIGIRKSMGASETGLLFLLSWGFIKILLISSAIALPISYLFFDQVLLADFAYRAPIGLLELLSGVLLVFGIAALAISSQTLRVARINPAKVLRTE